MTLEDRVKEIVGLHLGLADTNIPPDSRIVEDLGADTFDLIELVMTYEEEFGIAIDGADADKLTTVEAVIAFLNARGCC